MLFEEFASAELRSLLRLATAVCNDASTAEDLVQDVLVKAHRHWGRIENTDDPAAYLRRMLINEHISWRRKWSRIIPTAALEDRQMQSDFAGAVVQRDLLTGLLSRLPRQQQTVLALRYYAGMSDAEIADAMRCSPGTVRGYASRALSTLRLHVEQSDDFIRTDWSR